MNTNNFSQDFSRASKTFERNADSLSSSQGSKFGNSRIEEKQSFRSSSNKFGKTGPLQDRTIMEHNSVNWSSDTVLHNNEFHKEYCGKNAGVRSTRCKHKKSSSWRES